jgi:tripeptide aminopeptidase
LPHPPIEIAFTAQEESGMIGSSALDCSQFNAKWGVIFDESNPIGKIILSAPGAWHIDATITGRAAHAGSAPEKGINALAVAMDAMSQFKVGRIDEETTANVGMIQAGTARNVVPDVCKIVAETRSRRQSKLARQKKTMVRAFQRAAKKHRAKLDLQAVKAYPLFRVSPRAPIAQRVRAAVQRIGREPKFEMSGGGSDANVFNARGIACVVVSTGVENIHTTREFLPVEELIKAAELALEVIKIEP